MVKLYDKGAYLVNGTKIVEEEAQAEALTGKKVCKDEARKGTIRMRLRQMKLQGTEPQSITSFS